MNRVARLSLAAGAALVGFACQDQRTPTSPLEPPAMQIQDGFNGGNSHFHFLPPIRPFNMPPPKTAPFNPNLSPVIDICEWNGTACVQQVAHLTMGTRGLLDRVFVLPEFEQYLALWRTDQLHLDPTKTYRISVLVGTRVLGFADVDVVKTLREASKVDRADFVPLLNNLILPIGFRIEQGALCDGVSCDSKTINLRQGGSVVLATTGDRVDIPAQTSDQVVTVTVKLCADPNGLLADLPHFGNCLTVTADPRLAAPLSPPATVSMCSLHDFIPGLVHAQQDLVTLHRQDIVGEGTTLTALPHSHDFCPTPIGAAPLQPARNWLVAGWRAARHGLATLFGARQLHAATAVLDVGGGGETPLFSDFQFLLPSQINFYGISDFGQRPAGAVLPAAVKVTDALGAGVANATVRFNYNPPSGAGGVVTGPATCHPGTTDNLVCTTDESGTIQVNWRLSDAANVTHLLGARGIGMGIHHDLEGNGPFDPCVPVVLGDRVTCTGHAEIPVDRNRGVITFTAMAVPPSAIAFETYPSGAPACGRCDVTDQFHGQGVDFAYESFDGFFTGGTLGDGNNVLYGDADNLSNHFVTSALTEGGAGISGTLTMTLQAPYPRTVRFELSTAPDVTPPLNVFDGSGSPVPAAQITRTFLRNYTNVAAAPASWNTVEVSSEAGIQRVVFIMTSYIQQIDNVTLIP